MALNEDQANLMEAIEEEWDNPLLVINRYLSCGYDLNFVDPSHSMTPFGLAIFHQRYDLAKRFVEHGASKTMAAADNNTPLHIFARSCTDLEQLPFLIEGEGVGYINTSDINGNTPLHLGLMWAGANMGDKPELRALVSGLLVAGADPTLKNKDGATPLTILTNDSYPGSYSYSLVDWLELAFGENINPSLFNVPKKKTVRKLKPHNKL